MNFSLYSDAQIATIYRIAKTKLYPFFRDPRAMINLRNELERTSEQIDSKDEALGQEQQQA